MASQTVQQLFRYQSSNGRRPLVIGMVHVLALPGTPKNQATLDTITEVACHEASIYNKLHLDGIIVENMHDIPYLNPSDPIGPEITASMTRIATEIRRLNHFKLMGVQVLTARNREALSIAQTTGFNFIRAEGYVFSHIGDEGFVDSCAGSLLRYRKQIGADHIAIVTDLKKKHSSHVITSDISLVDTVDAARFFLTDGAVLTGTATGKATCPKELEVIVSHADNSLPVLVGSGINRDNMAAYWPADGWIIGSDFKENGHWSNGVHKGRVEAFMKNFEQMCRIRWTD